VLTERSSSSQGKYLSNIITAPASTSYSYEYEIDPDRGGINKNKTMIPTEADDYDDGDD